MKMSAVKRMFWAYRQITFGAMAVAFNGAIKYRTLLSHNPLPLTAGELDFAVTPAKSLLFLLPLAAGLALHPSQVFYAALKPVLFHDF